MDEIASESVLQQAFAWLCERRREYSSNETSGMSAGVGRKSADFRPSCGRAVCLGPVRRFHPRRRDHRGLVGPRCPGAKATALVLTAHWLPDFSPHCHHLEGRGGAKAAVRFVHEHLAANTFVFRTDVKSDYASIDHDVLLAMLEHHVPDGRVLDLLRQYVRRTIYDGGLYEDVERGISLGCPLSPLDGGVYLKVLDERVEATGLAYARFMDDW